MRILRNALARRVWTYIQRLADKIPGFGLRPFPERWAAPSPAPSSGPARPRAPEHADERTLRRTAEAQRGGLSSEESAARYARGDNPGGTHRKAVRHEGAEHQRPGLYEPQERKETVPGGERHIAVMRRGA
jgi:hypothetical protein